MIRRPVMSLLLVEDNRGDARLLHEMFREQSSHQVDVMHVECLGEAEVYLARHSVDLILLDLGLPDAEGMEAVQRVHATAPHTALVVLTGLDDESQAVKALQEGAQDYLIKGQIDTRALPRVLRYAIERKLMEESSARAGEALRTSEASLRRLVDSDIIGVAFWRVTGEILDANALLLTMLGYSQADLESGALGWSGMTPPEFKGVDEKALAEMMATGTCQSFEKDFIRKDGSRLTVLVGSLLERESGTVTSFVTDITTRKRVGATLRLQSAALNAADNAMVITERDLSVVWINPAFTELTGYISEEAIGRNAQDLLRSGAHDAAFYEEILSTIQRGETWQGEMTNRDKDGRLYPEAQTITPVKDDDGSISHFISIKTDLTGHRAMEAQLRQAQKMEAVGQLAAGVAHEFNNILQALMSMAAITRLRAVTPEMDRTGAEMEEQIRRGAALTQQLLLYSRHHAIQKSAIDLGEQVRKASVLLRQLIAENIRIDVEITEDRLPVDGDEGQMQQVILNLAINARDAMADGGTLTLRAGCSNDEVFLDVEDTGHGMDEATMAHIFEPFFTTKAMGKGTGLGLAVVRGIVEEHGGTIDVQHGSRGGTRFRVVLPASLGERARAPEARWDAELPLASGRVLLVEDEEGVREGIAILLEIIGYEVIAVGSGEEALALPREPAPDLLLTDLTLPGVAGLALGYLLRARWPELKVVLMSGYIEDVWRSGADEEGWHFLEKPFELPDLAAYLQAAREGKAPRPADGMVGPDGGAGSEPAAVWKERA
ncbi:MAG: response regulator [Acidobacteriota bacterium]